MARFVSDEHFSLVHQNLKSRKPRRALALGGGGPAVGISIGFLQAWEEWNDQVRDKEPWKVIEFPIWVAGCVGGWLACLYHLCDAPRAQEVEKMMRGFFRETDMYANFPAPKTFTPDLPAMIKSGLDFLVDPRTYENLVVPDQIARAYSDIVNFYLTPSKWNKGDFSYLMLNSVFAPNPASRLLMSLLYKAPDPGLNTIWFGDDYTLLQQFDLDRLRAPELPDIFINSYNIETHQSDIYCNHPERHVDCPVDARPITMPALCASSALPYILSPVQVDGQTHVEGALIDSFCFGAVHECHHDLNEVWVSRIVDHLQVKAPTNLLEALNNLIMLYAGTTSKNDIELFVNEINHHELYVAPQLRREKHAAYKHHEPEPIEIFQLPVESTTTYEWSYANLDNSIRRSKASCLEFLKHYAQGLRKDGTRVPHMGRLFSPSSPYSPAAVFRT